MRKEAEIAQALETLGAHRGEDAPLVKRLRRPETTWDDITLQEPSLARFHGEVAQQVVHDVKYAGYVARQEVDIARHRRLSEKRIPDSFDFSRIVHLRAEAREKLARIRPSSLAQASRISGITPADVALLVIHLGGK